MNIDAVSNDISSKIGFQLKKKSVQLNWDGSKQFKTISNNPYLQERKEVNDGKPQDPKSHNVSQTSFLQKSSSLKTILVGRSNTMT